MILVDARKAHLNCIAKDEAKEHFTEAWYEQACMGKCRRPECFSSATSGIRVLMGTS